MNDLLHAINELTEAKLALATTPAEKIDALQKRVEHTKQVEEKIRQLYLVGMKGGEAKEYALAKRERQSAEIALLDARIKAKR